MDYERANEKSKIGRIIGNQRQDDGEISKNLHNIPFEREYSKLDIRYDVSVDNLIEEIHFLKESIHKIKTIYQMERNRISKENQDLKKKLEEYEIKLIAARDAIKTSSADYQQMVAKCQDENKRLNRQLDEERARPSVDEATRRSMQSTILEVHDLRLTLQHIEERYKSERAAWLTRNQDLTVELNEAIQRSREDNKALAEAAVFYQTSLAQFRKENYILKEELMGVKVIKAANEEEVKKCREEIDRLNEALEGGGKTETQEALDEEKTQDELEDEEDEEEQQTVAPNDNYEEEPMNEQNTTAEIDNLLTEDVNQDPNATNDQLSQQLNDMENPIRSSVHTDDPSPPVNPVDMVSDKSDSWVEIADIKEEKKQKLSRSEKLKIYQDEMTTASTSREVEKLRKELMIQQKMLLSLQGSMLRSLDKDDNVPRRESDIKFRMLTAKIKNNERNFLSFQKELEEIIELAKLEDNAMQINDRVNKRKNINR